MTDSLSAQPKRGRPPKHQASRRQDELLEHCLEQFMKLGYRNTTMDGISTSFGASKSTLYRRYGSKAGLLRAAMARGVPLLLEPLSAVPTNPERTPHDVLLDYAFIIQDYANDPSIRALWRAVSEAREDLGEALEDVTSTRNEILTPIVGYLSQLARESRLMVDDPDMAAACFTELASGGISNFLGHPLPAGERRKLAEFAVNLFLNGTLPQHAG